MIAMPLCALAALDATPATRLDAALRCLLGVQLPQDGGAATGSLDAASPSAGSQTSDFEARGRNTAPALRVARRLANGPVAQDPAIVVDQLREAGFGDPVQWEPRTHTWKGRPGLCTRCLRRDRAVDLARRDCPSPGYGLPAGQRKDADEQASSKRPRLHQLAPLIQPPSALLVSLAAFLVRLMHPCAKQRRRREGPALRRAAADHRFDLRVVGPAVAWQSGMGMAACFAVS